MTNKLKYLLRDGIIIIVVLLVLVAVYGPWSKRFLVRISLVDIITEKPEYQTGESMRIKIENYLDKNICFSSCYPYYLEIKDDKWRAYQYVDCPYENIVENCIEPGKVKAFETFVPDINNKGFHRLAVPACVGCNFQEEFRQDRWFYSNRFIIQ